jgi:hypothetical protein
VGAGIYEISTVVENIGFLATNLSEQALLMAAAPPVLVELESQDDIHVLHGSRRQEIGHLAGRGSRPTIRMRRCARSAAPDISCRSRACTSSRAC